MKKSEIRDRLKLINEATIAQHCANGNISNRVLECERIINEVDEQSLLLLESENVEVLKQIERDNTEKISRKTKRKTAKEYLKNLDIDNIKNIEDVKGMVWHLKNLMDLK